MRDRTRTLVAAAGFTLLALTFLAAESGPAHLIAAGYVASVTLLGAAMVDLAQTRHLRRKLARLREQRAAHARTTIRTRAETLAFEAAIDRTVDAIRAHRPPCPAITDQARLRGETLDTVRLRYPHTQEPPA